MQRAARKSDCGEAGGGVGVGVVVEEGVVGKGSVALLVLYDRAGVRERLR